jgi:hypothetical protein
MASLFAAGSAAGRPASEVIAVFCADVSFGADEDVVLVAVFGLEDDEDAEPLVEDMRL